MPTHENLLGQPQPTLLPHTPQADDLLGAGTDPAEVAASYPAVSLVWAELADRAYSAGHTIESYAYARTGYHRGLDALRRNGWKGHGPVPWSHAPNRGWLRCVHALARAAADIGEEDEVVRCRQLLDDSDPQAAAVLG
jgi:hypothetical protein